MTGRTILNSGTSGPPGTATDPNQPMDLAQKTQTTRITDAVTNVKGTTFLPFGSTQLIATNALTHVTNKAGAHSETSVAGTGVTLFSRQPASSSAALNLVASSSASSASITPFTSSGSAAPPNRPQSGQATSVPSTYHIPRGAAAVANMAASRTQNVASIVRSTPQTTTTSSPRASIISQRMVTSGNWMGRTGSPTGVITAKPTSATPPLAGRPASMIAGRAPHAAAMPVSSYHTGKPPTVVTGAVRPTVSGGGRSPIEIPRPPHPAKGLHIAHSVTSAQSKYVGATVSASVRGAAPTTAFLPTGGVVSSSSASYSPSATLVTSLASSGTTITPHPSNRVAAAVRITSAPTAVVANSAPSSTMAPLGSGGLCLTSPSGVLMTHPGRAHTEHVTLKTPLVRGSHPHGAGGPATLPVGTHITVSGPKVVPPPPLGHVIANMNPSAAPSGVTTQAGLGAVPFSSRSGPPIASAVGRGLTPTISMTKMVSHAKGSTMPHAMPAFVNVSAPNAHHPLHPGSHPSPPTSDGSSHGLHSAHTNMFLPKTNIPAVSMTTVTSGSHMSERNVAAQYSIGSPYSSQPYYLESGNQGLPVNASVLPANQYVSSASVGGGSALRIGGASASLPPTTDAHQQGAMKSNASPRPSILRKRPEECLAVPLKAAKNLTAALGLAPMASPPSPLRPDSRGNGAMSTASSGGSTTVSANSSPGGQFKEDDVKMKSDTSSEERATTSEKACVLSLPLERTLGHTPDGVSPRKKPRKQQLMGNELHEARLIEEDFVGQPIIKRIKKEYPINRSSITPDSEDDDKDSSVWTGPPTTPSSRPPSSGVATPPANSSDGGWRQNEWNSEVSRSPSPVVPRRPHMSILQSYRQTWKARHNHFASENDVRPKEERRRSVNELVNQKMAMQRVNGWKVFHITGQVEDLAEMENDVKSRLQSLLNTIEKRQSTRKPYKDFDKDVNRLSELVKANMQRSVIIRDQMQEAKSQMKNLFLHKENVVSILTKHSNKRQLRKNKF